MFSKISMLLTALPLVVLLQSCSTDTSDKESDNAGGLVYSTPSTGSSNPPLTPATSDSRPAAGCLEDVKQCPDGSYVSRSGASCEFAACPR